MYIMKKLNREKKAATEERKKELEAQGYQCIKNSGKKAKTEKDAGAGDGDGSNGPDNTGKN